MADVKSERSIAKVQVDDMISFFISHFISLRPLNVNEHLAEYV